MSKSEISATTEKPVRTKPLPLEFPGVHHMDREEVEAAVRVLEARSLFRYYGIDLQKEVLSFEREFAAFQGSKYAVAVNSVSSITLNKLDILGEIDGDTVEVHLADAAAPAGPRLRRPHPPGGEEVRSECAREALHALHVLERHGRRA